MPARVKTVQKSRKAGKCSACGDPLPIGSAYRYFKPGFRTRLKVIRCMKPECTPKASELTTSRMSEAYAAQEDAHAAIESAETVDDLTSALEDAAGRASDLKDEYDQAIEAAPMLEEQVQPQVDALEAWAETLEGVSLDDIEAGDVYADAHAAEEPDEFETDEELEKHQSECELCQAKFAEELDERKDEAREAIDALEY